MTGRTLGIGLIAALFVFLLTYLLISSPVTAARGECILSYGQLRDKLQGQSYQMDESSIVGQLTESGSTACRILARTDTLSLEITWLVLPNRRILPLDVQPVL